MKHYALAAAAMMAAFLGLFLAAAALDVPLLADPRPALAQGGAFAAATSVGLLVGDVFLPVPSSLVMVANGALFGAAAGTALSLAGSLGGAALGFWIGRRGGPLLARLVPADERARADAALARWGAVAVILSRPVPIVAETVSILAGASSMGWGPFVGSALAGALPASAVYALAGATAATLDSAVLVFILVLATTGVFWWLRPGRRGP